MPVGRLEVGGEEEIRQDREGEEKMKGGDCLREPKHLR